MPGHADVASTERYAHLADEHVRAAAGRISGIVHGAKNGKESGRCGNRRRIRRTVQAVAAAQPAEREYTLRDSLRAHVGV